MDLIEVDAVGLEVRQGAVAGRDHLVVGEVIRKDLCHVDHFVADPGRGGGQCALGVSLAVHLGRVEGIDTGIHRGADAFSNLPIVDTGPHLFSGLPQAHDDRRNHYIRVS